MSSNASIKGYFRLDIDMIFENAKIRFFPLHNFAPSARSWRWYRKLSFLGDSELFANRVCQLLVDVGMSRKGRFHFCLRVDVNVMFFAVV